MAWKVPGKLVVLPLLAWFAADPLRAGEVCIAPFRADPAHGPQMDNTPAPLPSSKFLFRVDRRFTATVAQGEMGRIEHVPEDRKVLVEIRLDGKPFEAFWIDLREEEGQRVCLWLYSGYWHWVDLGWDDAHGCKCGKEAPDA